LRDFHVNFITNILALLTGGGDEYPENSFHFVGQLEEAFEKGRRIAKESEKK
jgi:F0F1-type ATP synthase beta subunit